jgi:hypothetical protein
LLKDQDGNHGPKDRELAQQKTPNLALNMNALLEAKSQKERELEILTMIMTRKKTQELVELYIERLMRNAIRYNMSWRRF